MKAWKTVALTSALLAAAGIGVAVVRAHEQTATAVVAGSPEPLALQALTQLRMGGGRLGVAIRDVNDDDVKRGRLDGSRGAVIDQVTEDSPAAKAGFKTGDIVVEFDGERVRSAQQLTRLVQETPGGRSVSAVVVRDGQKTSLSVEPRDAWEGLRGEIGDFLRYEFPSRVVTPRAPRAPRPATPPHPPAVPAPLVESFSFRSGTALGITISDMSDQLAEYFGAKDGALVTSVRDDSAAAKAGVKAGDVVTSINGQDVKVPSDVRRAIGRLEAGADFTIDVLRDKKKMTLKGKTESRQDRRRVII
jgi:S1-C subfamily serine protease